MASALNFISSYSLWDSVEGGQTRLESCEENLGFLALGRELWLQPMVSHRIDLTLARMRIPEPTYTVASFRQHQSRIQCFRSGISKRRSWQAPDPAEVNSASRGQHMHITLPTWFGLNFTVSQPPGSISGVNEPIAVKRQVHQESPHNPYKKHSWSTEHR